MSPKELDEVEALCKGNYTITIHDFTGSEEDRSALANLRRIQAIVDCVPKLLEHIRQQAQELEGEKRASKIYREEAEGYRRENEKLRQGFKEQWFQHNWRKPEEDHADFMARAEEALSVLVGEVRPIFPNEMKQKIIDGLDLCHAEIERRLAESSGHIFQEGDAEALEKVAFDFEHLARDGGMAELFIEHHCEVLRRLAEVAKGGQG